MRLIDADAIVLEYGGLAHISPCDFRGIAEYFAKQIMEMPTVNQWIPCSERLPDEAVEVFIYVYGNVPVIAWLDSGRWCTEDYLVDEDDEPTAWMPLPQPYRGDDK